MGSAALHRARVGCGIDPSLVLRTRFDAFGRVLACALAVGLCAHLALDRIANLVLAHDPYDDLAHPSRAPVFLFVAAFVTLAAARALYAALVEASRRCGRVLPAVGPAESFTTVAFRAFAGGCVALPALEAIDSLLAGRQVTSASALFAGSFGLGLAVIAVVALVGTAALRAMLRHVVALRPAIVAAIASFVSAASDADVCIRGRQTRTFRRNFRNDPFSIRAGKRAPPTPTTA